LLLVLLRYRGFDSKTARRSTSQGFDTFWSHSLSEVEFEETEPGLEVKDLDAFVFVDHHNMQHPFVGEHLDYVNQEAGIGHLVWLLLVGISFLVLLYVLQLVLCYQSAHVLVTEAHRRKSE